MQHVEHSRRGYVARRRRNHLDQLVPARKVWRIRHDAVMPYAELPAFMAELRNQAGTAARALEFTILTVARTTEALGAVPAELDRDAKLWIVPPESMKGGRLHRVRFSPPAVA